MSEPNRRRFLCSTLGAAIPATTASTTTADVTSPTLVAMRQLIRDYRAAEAHSIALEDIPGHDALPAYAEARAREKALAAEFDALWALPVTCFADVVARAEAAALWNAGLEKGCDGIDGTNSPYFDDRALARLVEAVLSLARPKMR